MRCVRNEISCGMLKLRFIRIYVLDQPLIYCQPEAAIIRTADFCVSPNFEIDTPSGLNVPKD